ncbi:hypothetical protein EV383_0197 [Pseudonocardia sediminis]|uniref:Uncharacterized protein n=1 Tax=Pseudonocardia sediminis TaxID=1397368 RepID=A0A4Q7UP84_PSEST|nr:hypothetical protein [Pseudonocardia sediminis]RZT83395.1 hypothetical protein EV383_0197 [Pseudonocardia sediminis]
MTDRPEPTTLDEDRPGSPADAMDIIRSQQAKVNAQLAPETALFFLFWGVAWVLIGVLAYLNSTDVIGGTTAGFVGAAVLLVAGGASAWVGIRSGRGVTGDSARQGMLYGLSWPIIMTLVGVFIGAAASTLGLTDVQMSVLVPAIFALVVGALYSAAGAIWGHVPNYVLGLWIVAVGVISVFVGFPVNTLVFGIGAGGGMLVVGGMEMARRGRR